MSDKITQERMSELLKEAEVAHAKYEEDTGETDVDWPKWYAEYIINKIKE